MTFDPESHITWTSHMKVELIHIFFTILANEMIKTKYWKTLASWYLENTNYLNSYNLLSTLVWNSIASQYSYLETRCRQQMFLRLHLNYKIWTFFSSRNWKKGRNQISPSKMFIIEKKILSSECTKTPGLINTSSIFEKRKKLRVQ